MKRTKLRDRTLPDYTRGEEIMNMLTHIIGGAVGLTALLLCPLRARQSGDPWDMAGALVYGICMVCLYAVSSVYHGLKPSSGKKVLQVLDHCAIYFLIAGTYTPITLSALRAQYPLTAWGLLAFEWSLTALAVTLTAIDLKRSSGLSMVCYIGMGWAVLPFMEQARQALTQQGFLFLLLGGIAYTAGAVLYGIGSKKRWFHSVFHIFVVLGSVLQLLSVLFYAL